MKNFQRDLINKIPELRNTANVFMIDEFKYGTPVYSESPEPSIDYYEFSKEYPCKLYIDSSMANGEIGQNIPGTVATLKFPVNINFNNDCRIKIVKFSNEILNEPLIYTIDGGIQNYISLKIVSLLKVTEGQI